MSSKDELIKLLFESGYLKQEDADNLIVSFSDLVAKFASDEEIILQEVKRIADKKDAGETLTAFEESTFQYFLSVYKGND